MRLTIYFLYVTWFSNVYSENIQQGQQFPFPPQFLLSNPFISTDSTIYLPPEFQTAASILSANMKNNPPNKPPAPAINTYPSSTVNYADINNLHRGEILLKHNLLPGTPSSSNQTNKPINRLADKRTFMTIPQAMNYKQNIDRMDTKVAQISAPKEIKAVVNPNPMLREVISVENNNQDLMQKASYHNIQYASPPPHIIIHSTTEPAIPILRLSNEMDLDGSFSYEALSADQTHYEQHSRMENIGTDKEGPIVEGSYSYVGDDGQTYTVHYIADSNGYRATGDHLPVAPPIPEIIQRSIQYNLAEEAKRPPNYQSYEEVENDSSPSNNDKININYYTTPRNLFTGRTPEAFSIGFPYGANIQNNLIPMASSKEPIKTNIKFSEDKTQRKNNYGPLEPQITFLASQGTHVPSSNPAQKSPMPQLVNIESGINDLDQDNYKGLLRWQNGANKTVIDIPAKDSISRSSGGGEDVIINFSDMTPEEYTKVMRKQIYKDVHANANSNDYQQQTEKEYKHNKNYLVDYLKESNTSYTFNNQIKHAIDESDKTLVSTSENSVIYTSSENPYDRYEENYKDIRIQEDAIVNRDKFDKKINYYPGVSSTVNSLWMDHEDNFDDLKTTIVTDQDRNNQNKYINYDYNYNSKPPQNLYWPVYDTDEKNNIISSTPSPVEYTYFIRQKEEKDPIIYKEIKEENLVQNKEQEITTTEPDISDVVRQNIFLRNLLIPKVHKPNEEAKANLQKENNLKPVSNPSPKSYNESKYYNQIKTIEKRPLDVSDVLNYIVHKNLFESNRLKMKNQSPPFKPQTSLNSLTHKPEVKLDDRIDGTKNKEKEDIQVTYNNFRQNPPQELRGNIKNYKVLLRNNARNSNTEAESQTQPLSGLQNKSIYVKYPPLGRAGPSMKSYLPPIYL